MQSLGRILETYIFHPLNTTHDVAQLVSDKTSIPQLESES